MKGLAWWGVVTLTVTAMAAGVTVDRAQRVHVDIGSEIDPRALCSRGDLACPDSGRTLSPELAGLTVTDIVEVQDPRSTSTIDLGPMQRSWEAVSRQCRSRVGGILHYDYGVLHCSEWLYGPPKRSELISAGGGVLVRADSVIILLLVVTSAMLWFVSACLNGDNRIPDTSHVCTDAEYAKLPPPPAGSARHRHTNGRVFYVSVTTQTPISSAGRVRLPGPPLLTRATRATSSSVGFRACEILWVAIGLTLAVLLPSQFKLWPAVLDGYCKLAFGPESRHGATPGWAAKIPIPARQHFVLLTGLPPVVPQGREGALAVLYKVISVDTAAAVALELVTACENGVMDEGQGRKPMSSAVGSEFRAWLNDFTYDCTVVRADPVVSLYVSHRAMAVKRLRVLSSEQSATIIELSEQHAAEAGWTTSRHANYATTDIPVSATYELHNFLNGADQLGQQIADKISDDLGLAAAPLWGLTPREMFVVKYTGADCDAGSALGCGQSSLGLHEDGSLNTVISYNILLNSPEDFEGGGTTFQMYGPLSFTRSDCGMATIHPSKMKHGGGTVTAGTRYILVGFLEFKSVMSSPIHTMLSLGDYLEAWAPGVAASINSLEHYTAEIFAALFLAVIGVISVLYFLAGPQESAGPSQIH